MQSAKLFNCQACDAEMEVAETREQLVTCRQCGRNHRLLFSVESKSWILQVEDSFGKSSGEDPEDSAFSVLGESGRPMKQDRSEKHREQTDVHPDNEAVANHSGRKP